jgi:hypothetical protein
MKQHSKINLSLIAALAVIGASSAKAQIIDVQFSNSNDPTAYTGTGVDPLQTTATAFNFLKSNGTSVSSATVVDTTPTDGANYTVSVTTSSFAGLNNTGFALTAANNGNLFNGYASEPGTGTGTFSISGLADSAAFTIYVFSEAGNANSVGSPRPATFALSSVNGGLTAAATGVQGNGAFTLGANYAVLTGTTSATGTIAGTFYSTTGTGEADFNGFQLDVPVSTPEPSTWAMLLGGFGLLVFVRRLRLS